MNNDLRPINTLPNFKRFCMTIGELPTSYLETMTYYEMLVWFTEYMKNTIIPTINNNGLAVQELQDKYIELKSYVDNYFNNLDVQEEINNKLDQMVQDGTLQEIIASYLNSKALFGFDNVESMKNSTNLINGSYAKTLGYYSINDDGGATYKIRNITNEDIVDEFKIVALSNENLIAELIIEEYITPEMAGCYGDNIHDDTINLQKAINSNYQIYTKNQYKISNTVTILNSFIMESKSYIHLTSNITSVGVLIGNTSSQQMNKKYDINVDCHNYSNIGIGVEVIKRCYCRFNIRNAGTTGIKMNYSGASGNNENQFSIHVFGNKNGTTENGVYLNCYDSIFSDIITIDCKNGIYLKGSLHANSVHSWLSNDGINTLWNDSCAIYCDGSHDCYVDWLYQDTVKYGIKGEKGFKGLINMFEFNCINNSEYYTTAQQVYFTGNNGINMYINNFVNDVQQTHLLTYTLPITASNVFGVVYNNGASPYYQQTQYHATFTDANDAPQLGSKYVKYDVANLPVGQNGVLSSEVKGNLVRQQFFPAKLTDSAEVTKKYFERFRTLSSNTWTNWIERIISTS